MDSPGAPDCGSSRRTGYRPLGVHAAGPPDLRRARVRRACRVAAGRAPRPGVPRQHVHDRQPAASCPRRRGRRRLRQLRGGLAEHGQDGSGEGVFGQRYDSSGAPLGPEFRVNTFTTGYQGLPAVAADLSGNFVVVWESGQDGAGDGIFGQRYASTGAPLGPEFRVNTFTTGNQARSGRGRTPPATSSSSGPATPRTGRPSAFSASATPAPAPPSDPSSGSTPIRRTRSAVRPSPPTPSATSWSSGAAHAGRLELRRFRPALRQLRRSPRPRVPRQHLHHERPGPAVRGGRRGRQLRRRLGQLRAGRLGQGVFGQRYASSGAPLGGEFRVNTYTTNSQYGPSVAGDAAGNFVVAWKSCRTAVAYGVFGQRYASSGAPLGPEFRVNTFTTSLQG